LKETIVSMLIILAILSTISEGFGANSSINFPDNKKYPGLYDVPDEVWGGKNHERLKKLYNQYMNMDTNTSGYLYGIALPGNGTGNVVLMVGMGKGEEVCDYMVSTSEAMGYGMIMAAIMGDKKTFDGLYKTVTYYQAYNPATGGFNPNLTSWCIPGVKGSLPSRYRMNLALSNRGNDVRDPGQILQGAPMDSSQCRSSATDGDQDIAYALLMAHWQWEAHAPANSRKQKVSYLAAASERFRAISKSILIEKVDQDGNRQMFLRTGDYFGDLNHSKNDLTRPSDWALTHFRTAAEIRGDLRFSKLIQSIYSYISNEKHPISQQSLIPDFGWWDEDRQTLRVASDNAIENPEHIDPPGGDAVSGYHWDDESLQKWKPAGVISDAYHWNACRYPWRMALDAIHYKDHRSLNEARRISRNLYNSFGRMQKKAGSEIAHDYHQLPMGTTLDGTRYLKEWSKRNPAESDPAKIRYKAEDAIWTSSAFTAPYLLAYGLQTPVQQEEEFIRAIERNLDGFIGAAPEWCEAEWETDPYTNSHDPFYSGYYEDSINLLSLLSLAGDWWKPHGWKNILSNPGFSDGINGWKVIAENGIEVEQKIITNNNSQSLYLRVTQVPSTYGIFDLKLVQDDLRLPGKTAYSFSINIERRGFDGSSAAGPVLAPSSAARSSVNDGELITMDQFSNSYYHTRIAGSSEGKSAEKHSGTAITIGLADNLKQGSELWLDNVNLR